MKNTVEEIIFTSICNNCNKKNEVAVPKKYIEKLTPRYCTECGNEACYLERSSGNDKSKFKPSSSDETIYENGEGMDNPYL